MRRSDFNRRVDLDVSTVEQEYELGYFPLEILFDFTPYAAWRSGYNRKFRQDEVHPDRFDEFKTQVVQRFQQYRVRFQLRSRFARSLSNLAPLTRRSRNQTGFRLRRVSTTVS